MHSSVADLDSWCMGEERIHGEREPIMGVWGLCPQWGPGAKPLVGGRGAKPPEADEILAIETVTLHHSFIKCGQFIEI